MKAGYKKIGIGILVIIGLLILSQFVFTRWDLTEDQRYSFSDTTEQVVNQISEPVEITVFLDGDLTGNFRVLKNEIQFFLNELHRTNPNIQYKFVDPVEKNLDLDSLYNVGVMSVSVPTKNKILRVFPFATVQSQNQRQVVSLLSNKKVPIEERALLSTDLIENNFIKALYRLNKNNRKNIGLIVHHDELRPTYLDGFLKLASKEYNITPYTRPITDSLNQLTFNDLDSLKKFDALIIAKPVKPFTQKDKEVIDQYIMNGGKTLWMTEEVDAEMDSLFRSNRILAFPRDLNLTDLFFAYGVRINPAIVKDLQSSYITLAIGEVGNNTAYEQFPWPYFPVSISPANHEINKKIGNPIKFEFANPIEILERDSVKSTILLTSSPNVQLQQAMSFIDFKEIENANSEEYPPQNGVYPFAVLLEGNFTSAYANRYESKEIPNFKPRSPKNKMIIISDGDFAKNHVFRGNPLPLGADKYSLRPDMPASPSVIYDNGAFLMNALDYLVNPDGLLSLNNKSRTIHVLNKTKVEQEEGKWRWINLWVPLLFIWLIAGIFIYYRKKKFG